MTVESSIVAEFEVPKQVSLSVSISEESIQSIFLKSNFVWSAKRRML